MKTVIMLKDPRIFFLKTNFQVRNVSGRGWDIAEEDVEMINKIYF